MSHVSNADVLAFFCSHFVALALETRPFVPNRRIHEVAPPHGSIGTRCFRAYSGFVIEVRGLWFLVTAGHIVHELEARLAREEESLVHVRLVDFLGPNANVSRSARGELVMGAALDPYELHSERSTLDFVEGLADHRLDLFPFLWDVRVDRQFNGYPFTSK